MSSRAVCGPTPGTLRSNSSCARHTGLRRIHEYCYPLEDARARRVYGVPSGVNNVLIISRVLAPQRVSAVLVREVLGF